MLIGFTDDSLAGIIANILADVANVWFYISYLTLYKLILIPSKWCWYNHKYSKFYEELAGRGANQSNQKPQENIRNT